MKIECENLSEREATPKLIRELIRDDARRGEFMILMQDADEEAFVQIAGDYEDVGGRNDGCFDLEYRDGASSPLYHANRRATADEVEQLFLSELRGDRSWRSRFEWETEKVGGGSVGIGPERKGLLGSKMLKAWFGLIVALGMAAVFGYQLWKMGRIDDGLIARGVDLLFIAIPGAIVISGVVGVIRAYREKGMDRKSRSVELPAEGRRLRPKLPTGVVFLFIWCMGWNGGALFGLGPQALTACHAFAEKGFQGVLVVWPLVQLIGLVMLGYWCCVVWRFLRPRYDVRLVGSILREGEAATFEYAYQGDAERVASVQFALACEAPTHAREARTLGAEPGDIRDSKTLSNALQIATGMVTLELPKIGAKDHTRYRYYLRITQKMKGGRKLSWSYRLPLK